MIQGVNFSEHFQQNEQKSSIKVRFSQLEGQWSVMLLPDNPWDSRAESHSRNRLQIGFTILVHIPYAVH